MAYLLTEDNIKHCALGFLKSYYKNNSSRGFGKTETKLDMVTEDGIVADGYLKFTLLDESNNLSGKPPKNINEGASPVFSNNEHSFLATFEATSQDTAEEIQYNVQNLLLIFDALAVAFLVAAGSYGFNFLRDQFTLNELGFVKFWAGFIAVLVATFIGYILIFRYIPRYRYIYAVAQFKTYSADEQWIAYGDDVFEHPENKYLLELKKQCMRKGFGLISVNDQLFPTLVMTPSRKEEGTRERIKRFFSASAQRTRKQLSWIKLPRWLRNVMPKWNRSLAMPVGVDTRDYMRYTQSYWKQGLLILFSILVMGEIYWEELKNPNIVYMDASEYEEKVLEQTKDNQPEPNVTFLDLETGDKKAVVDPESSNKNIPTDTEYVDPIITTKKQNPVLLDEFTQKGVIVSTGANEFISYSCNRLAHLQEEVFVVQVDVAHTYPQALELVKNYTKNGFKVNAVSLSCFYKSNKEYVIYLGDILASKAEATDKANQYHQQKIAKGEYKDQTLIRVIKKMKS